MQYALELSIVICVLLFCLNNVALNYKNKLVSVLFTHSNLNNCSFFILSNAETYFLSRNVRLFIGYIFCRQAKTV